MEKEMRETEKAPLCSRANCVAKEKSPQTTASLNPALQHLLGKKNGSSPTGTVFKNGDM